MGTRYVCSGIEAFLKRSHLKSSCIRRVMVVSSNTGLLRMVNGYVLKIDTSAGWLTIAKRME